MKLTPTNKLSKLSIIVSTMSLLVLVGSVLAGSLTPPSSPASTFHTLQELYDSITGTFDSSAIVASQTGSLVQGLKYIQNNLFVASSSSGFYFTPTTRNVGIGTSAPEAKLEINGTASISNGFFVGANGNVGVGTTNPLLKGLHVFRSNTDNAALLFIQQDGPANSTLQYQSGATSWYTGVDNVTGRYAIHTNALFNTSARLTIELGGNVGINDITPDALLDVEGTASISGNFGVDTNVLYVNTTSDNVGIGTKAPTGKLHISRAANGTLLLLNNSASPTISASISLDSASNFSFTMRDSGAARAVVLDTNSSNPSFINAGNFGIGTITPAAKLNVSRSFPGTVALFNISSSPTVLASISFDASGNLSFGMTDAGAVRDVVLDTNSANPSWINAGNFGIGTTTPGAKLEIKHSALTSGTPFAIRNSNNSITASISFRVDSGGNALPISPPIPPPPRISTQAMWASGRPSQYQFWIFPTPPKAPSL